MEVAGVEGGQLNCSSWMTSPVPSLMTTFAPTWVASASTCWKFWISVWSSQIVSFFGLKLVSNAVDWSRSRDCT